MSANENDEKEFYELFDLDRLIETHKDYPLKDLFLSMIHELLVQNENLRTVLYLSSQTNVGLLKEHILVSKEIDLSNFDEDTQKILQKIFLISGRITHLIKVYRRVFASIENDLDS